MKYSVHKLNTRMVAMVIMLVCFGTLTVRGASLSDCLLRIADVDVTTDNAANVTAPEGSGCEISGVSYDVASHTLTLDNAVIKAPRTGSDYGPNAIWYIKFSPDGPDLTIRLIGKSYIETAYEAIYVTGNLIIKSGHPDSRHRPVLQVRVTDVNRFSFSGIDIGTQDDEYLYSTLDIYDCDVDVESPAPAILGFDNYGDGRFVSLNVNLHGIATLRAKTRSTRETEGALKNVVSIDYDDNTDGSRFQMPRNVEYNSGLMNFTEDGETPYYAKEVRVASHIDFADPEVERLCVENWDENADGKLDNIEASRVTNLGYVFQDNEEIWCFDELDEFYGLENISQAFQGCTNLSGVTLPYYLKTTSPKAISPSVGGTVPCIFTVSSLDGLLLYCMKADSPMEVTEAGISTYSRLVPQKANEPMVFSPRGSTTRTRGASRNAFSPMLVSRPSPSKTTSVSSLQSLNAQLLTSST